MDASTRLPNDAVWYRVDAAGFSKPVVIFRARNGWRARFDAIDDNGVLSFFAGRSPEPAALSIAFGDFAAAGAAIEFVAGVASGCGVLENLLSSVAERRGGDLGPKAARETFFALEEDADPVSASRAAVVLIFDCENPGFNWRLDEAVAAARLMPIRSDPAPEGYYDGHVETAKREAFRPDGIDVASLIGSEADETAVYDHDDDDTAWGASSVAMRVRPMGVLVSDAAEDVARVASVYTTRGTVKLKVDEKHDDGIGQEGVVRRSFSVLTVMRIGDLQNTQLRSAMLGMMKDSASRSKGARAQV